MPTLKEKLEITEQQILDGKRALSYALQYAGVSAVVPNDDVPDEYETFQSYADKIRRLQLANSLIFEFTIPEGNLTKYKRTVILPISGLNYDTLAQTIINSDTEYQGISTLELEPEPVVDTHIIKDNWNNDINDGNYQITMDELMEYLPEDEAMEMANAMEALGVPVAATSSDSEVMPLADTDANYSYTVEWGDGTSAEYTSTASTEAIYHTYDQPGTYDVSINGNFRIIKKMRLDLRRECAVARKARKIPI